MFLIYLAIGRLLIWAISAAKPTQFIWKFFDECDFCLGFWVYFFLGFWFTDVVVTALPIFYVPVLSQIIIGILASKLVQIFVLGWKKNDTVVIY